jgi:hypothetical protein
MCDGTGWTFGFAPDVVDNGLQALQAVERKVWT